LIGRFDLVHHRLVHVSPGEQSRDRSQHRKDGSAKRHPRNPRFATVFGAVMDLFLQMLERYFWFFHAINCEVCDAIQERIVLVETLTSILSLCQRERRALSARAHRVKMVTAAE
jgi:hypothetical protein